MRHSKIQEQENQHMKGRMTVMKKRFFKKGLVVGALALAMMAGSALFGTGAKASTAIKCYTISSGNTTVYSNTGLTRKYGTIFGSDQITVKQVTDRYCKVSYPISRGTKTGYIRTSAILTKTMGSSYKSRAKITTYRRPGGGSYGYVSNGDTVKVLGTYGSYTQLKYPVSGGYKYAFVSTSNYNAYIKPISVSRPAQPAVNNNALGAPVPAGAKFNMKTYDGGWYGYHDINRNVSISTPVYALCDGTVTYKQAYTNFSGIKKLTSYGNFIEFTSANGVYKAKYCHLNSFVGARQIISSSQTRRRSGSSGVYTIKTKSVRKGEIIGYIGKTGNASGIHLHFELRRNNSRIDPTSVISGLI